MKRKCVVLPVAMLSTLALVASAPASTSHGSIVKERGTGLGKLLVTRRGHLLYVFAPDKHNKDVCIKISGCIKVWPALTTRSKPVAKGVAASLLGTIKLPHGKKQVTYAGHPLYTWIHDLGGGDTSYVGANINGGAWYAINVAGKVVKH